MENTRWLKEMVNRQYQCPVCGAPIEGEKCEYCGCVIYDFANVSTDEPRYIRLAMQQPDGQKYLIQMKAIAVNPCIEIKSDAVDVIDMCGHALTTITSMQTCTMNIEFKAVEEDGTLLKAIAYDKPYRESWRDDIEC